MARKTKFQRLMAAARKDTGYVEVRELWRAALRSGEFEQGTSALCHNDCYCVTGVLCELHRRVFDGEWKPCPGPIGCGDSYLGFAGQPALPVREWAGVTFDKCQDLMDLNDSDMTFLSLARRI